VTINEGEPSPFSRALIAGKKFWHPADWAKGFTTSNQAIVEGGGIFLIEGFARKATRREERERT
jgi:hypothetical protein